MFKEAEDQSPCEWNTLGDLKVQATMKRLVITLPILLCATWLCGCVSVDHGAGGKPTGTLVVRLTTLHGLEGSYRDARIYVDGRFVGSYEPEETELVLAAGAHKVKVDVPRVYSRELLPDGSTRIRAYALKGEERIEVLGGGSKQSLVFNEMNLRREEIDDPDGH